MATYDVYLEVTKTGATLAHVPDLLGCHLFADSSDAAMEGLPARIAEYVDWRRAMHIPLPPAPGPRRLNLAEEVFGSSLWTAPGLRTFFAWDAHPLTKTQLGDALKILDAARRTLRELVSGIHPRVMLWKSSPKARSIRRTLTHLETRERWYLSRLGVELPHPRRISALRLLESTHAAIVETLRGMDEQTRTVIFEPRRGAANSIEKWTARKVMRRLVEHEMEHIETIRDIARRYSESTPNRLTR